MNRIGLLLLLLMVIQPTVAQQQPTAQGRFYRTPAVQAGFLKAQQYLDMNPTEQRDYAMGLLDGFHLAPFFGAPEDDKVLTALNTCVGEGMRASQVAAIIEKYIREHPEWWHTDLAMRGYDAIEEACHIQILVPAPEDRHLIPEK